MLSVDYSITRLSTGSVSAAINLSSALLPVDRSTLESTGMSSLSGLRQKQEEIHFPLLDRHFDVITITSMPFNLWYAKHIVNIKTNNCVPIQLIAYWK